MDHRTIIGKEVLPALAQIYPQLYLVPGQAGSEEICKEIITRGQIAPSTDLSHFNMNEEDRYEILDTPAGSVPAVTLYERSDFECLLRILEFRCAPAEIPATQGAVILDGLVNWQKIRAHKEAWMKERGGDVLLFLEWAEELKAFTKDRNNYKDVLIILSAGPYSNTAACALGMDEEKWRRFSVTIRKIHECTHFICRKLFPERIDAVWDEIVADAAGILAAFGKYEPETEALFLGVSENGYTGGRLENYIEGGKETLDRAAGKVREVLFKIRSIYEEDPDIEPFAFALRLEEKQKDWWGPF